MQDETVRLALGAALQEPAVGEVPPAVEAQRLVALGWRRPGASLLSSSSWPSEEEVVGQGRFVDDLELGGEDRTCSTPRPHHTRTNRSGVSVATLGRVGFCGRRFLDAAVGVLTIPDQLRHGVDDLFCSGLAAHAGEVSRR